MTDTYACGITMHRPLGDLYDILNIDDKLPTDAIRGLFEDEELTDDQRYAWKALSDPFYSVVYRCERNTRRSTMLDSLTMVCRKWPRPTKHGRLKT